MLPQGNGADRSRLAQEYHAHNWKQLGIANGLASRKKPGGLGRVYVVNGRKRGTDLKRFIAALICASALAAEME